MDQNIMSLFSCDISLQIRTSFKSLIFYFLKFKLNDNCCVYRNHSLYSKISYCGIPVGVGCEGGCGGGGWDGGAVGPSVELPIVTEWGTESCGVVEWACWTGKAPAAAATAAAE